MIFMQKAESLASKNGDIGLLISSDKKVLFGLIKLACMNSICDECWGVNPEYFFKKVESQYPVYINEIRPVLMLHRAGYEEIKDEMDRWEKNYAKFAALNIE